MEQYPEGGYRSDFNPNVMGGQKTEEQIQEVQLFESLIKHMIDAYVQFAFLAAICYLSCCCFCCYQIVGKFHRHQKETEQYLSTVVF
jgi:hypothetical protein